MWSSFDGPSTSADDKTSNIEHLLSLMTEPVVGLDCIQERERIDGFLAYECLCCDEMGLTEDVVPSHVISKRHRQIFLQTSHAELVQRMGRGRGSVDSEEVARVVAGQFGSGRIRRISRLFSPGFDGLSSSYFPNSNSTNNDEELLRMARLQQEKTVKLREMRGGSACSRETSRRAPITGRDVDQIESPTGAEMTEGGSSESTQHRREILSLEMSVLNERESEFMAQLRKIDADIDSYHGQKVLDPEFEDQLRRQAQICMEKLEEITREKNQLQNVIVQCEKDEPTKLRGFEDRERGCRDSRLQGESESFYHEGGRQAAGADFQTAPLVSRNQEEVSDSDYRNPKPFSFPPVEQPQCDSDNKVVPDFDPSDESHYDELLRKIESASAAIIDIGEPLPGLRSYSSIRVENQRKTNDEVPDQKDQFKSEYELKLGHYIQGSQLIENETPSDDNQSARSSHRTGSALRPSSPRQRSLSGHSPDSYTRDSPPQFSSRRSPSDRSRTRVSHKSLSRPSRSPSGNSLGRSASRQSEKHSPEASSSRRPYSRNSERSRSNYSPRRCSRSRDDSFSGSPSRRSHHYSGRSLSRTPSRNSDRRDSREKTLKRTSTESERYCSRRASPERSPSRRSKMSISPSASARDSSRSRSISGGLPHRRPNSSVHSRSPSPVGHAKATDGEEVVVSSLPAFIKPPEYSSKNDASPSIPKMPQKVQNRPSRFSPLAPKAATSQTSVVGFGAPATSAVTAPWFPTLFSYMQPSEPSGQEDPTNHEGQSSDHKKTVSVADGSLEPKDPGFSLPKRFSAVSMPPKHLASKMKSGANEKTRSTLGMVGRKIGGKVLKTGMVMKTKKAKGGKTEEPEADYMAEVLKLSAGSCEKINRLHHRPMMR